MKQDVKFKCPYCNKIQSVRSMYNNGKMWIDYEYLGESIYDLMTDDSDYSSIALEAVCPDCEGDLRIYLDIKMYNVDVYNETSSKIAQEEE